MQRNVPELPARRTACLLARHPGTNVAIDQELEMGLEFSSDLVVGTAASPRITKSRPQRANNRRQSFGHAK